MQKRPRGAAESVRARDDLSASTTARRTIVECDGVSSHVCRRAKLADSELVPLGQELLDDALLGERPPERRDGRVEQPAVDAPQPNRRAMLPGARRRRNPREARPDRRRVDELSDAEGEERVGLAHGTDSGERPDGLGEDRGTLYADPPRRERLPGLERAEVQRFGEELDDGCEEVQGEDCAVLGRGGRGGGVGVIKSEGTDGEWCEEGGEEERLPLQGGFGR